MKWSEVKRSEAKGIRTEQEIEYFQEQKWESDKWS